MTEKFIAENPTLVFISIFLLISLIKLMGWALSKLITQPYKNLTVAIDSLAVAVQHIREDITTNNKEAKQEREKDRKQIGFILDRLQAQETLCKTTRSFCPHHTNNLD